MGKHPHDDEFIVDSESSLKRSKTEHDAFHRALSDLVGGNPTKSRLQRLHLPRLLAICRDFSLWDNSSGEKVTKAKCIERIISHLQGLKSQSDDESMESFTEPSANIRIRLYKNPADYETRYIEEVEAPLSPGGLNLDDLPNLFQTDGTFKVVEGRRYKPVMISSNIVPREMLDILLQDSQYIRVICIV